MDMVDIMDMLDRKDMDRKAISILLLSSINHSITRKDLGTHHQ